MIRKPKTIAFWTGRLPHWEVEDGRYFITIHLAGAIPHEGRQRIRAIAESLHASADRESNDWLERQRAIFREMEEWLDRSEWNTWLKSIQVAEMVTEAIQHRHATHEWNMIEYVVMPTHLHLFCEIGKKGLAQTLEDFKRWTGRCAAKILNHPDERFWQREWFDHWSRSDEEDEKIRAYIRNNPVKAGLVSRYEDYRYGSWRK